MAELATVHVAASPTEAKLLAALLIGEGIPAQTRGESLADPVAISQRLMNTAGTRVLVPSSELEHARAVLATASDPIPDDELERQALAAEAAPQSKPDNLPFWFWPMLLLAALIVIGWSVFR